jgi:release factor glutamine methyltransferase
VKQVAPAGEGQAGEAGTPTVGAALRLGRAALADRPDGQALALATPSLDAEVLLCFVLGIDRATLFAYPERRLAPAAWVRYRALLTRRAAGEPVAYLIGQREFMGLDFAVDRRVLIPRPETETLVERALAWLAGRVGAPGMASDGRHGQGWRWIADVGTGSGAIAVSLAALLPQSAAWRIVATDRSSGALGLARANADRLLPAAVRLRMSFVHCSLLSAVRGPFDLVVANLPYIPTMELAQLPATVREYEPAPALDGGSDGLDLYRALLVDLGDKLRPGGAILLECDPRQVPALRAMVAKAAPAMETAVHRDLAGQVRVVEGQVAAGRAAGQPG